MDVDQIRDALAAPNSPLKPHTIEAIRTELADCIETEAVIAKEVGVSAHRLSRFLNCHIELRPEEIARVVEWLWTRPSDA